MFIKFALKIGLKIKEENNYERVLVLETVGKELKITGDRDYFPVGESEIVYCISPALFFTLRQWPDNVYFANFHLQHLDDNHAFITAIFTLRRVFESGYLKNRNLVSRTLFFTPEMKNALLEAGLGFVDEKQYSSYGSLVLTFPITDAIPGEN